MTVPYSSLRYRDSRLPFHTNSGTAIPTAKFVSNVFAMKDILLTYLRPEPRLPGRVASQNDTITFGNFATAYDNSTLGAW